MVVGSSSGALVEEQDALKQCMQWLWYSTIQHSRAADAGTDSGISVVPESAWLEVAALQAARVGGGGVNASLYLLLRVSRHDVYILRVLNHWLRVPFFFRVFFLVEGVQQAKCIYIHTQTHAPVHRGMCHTH